MSTMIKFYPPPHNSDFYSEGKLKRQINQVFLQGWDSSIAPEILRSIELMKRLNPTWEHKLWDECMVREYIRTHYGVTILSYYDRISPHYPNARVDFFKFLLIYNEGGLYLDHKSCVTQPIEQHLQDGHNFVISYWDTLSDTPTPEKRPTADTPCGLLMLWFVLGKRHHPVGRELIIQVLKNIDKYNPIEMGVGGLGSFNLAGPTMYTEVISQSRYPVQYCYFIEDWGGVFTVFGKDIEKHRRSGKHVRYQSRIDPLVYNGSLLGRLLYTMYEKLVAFRRSE